MRTLILLFCLGLSAVHAQCDCSNLAPTFSGECETFDQVSGVRGKLNYKKGVKYGSIEEWYTNGQQRAKGNFKKGYLNGDFKAYYSTGETMTVGKFKSGSGDFAMYHPNGEVKTKGQFVDGIASGTWYNYSDKGDLLGEVNAENGKFDMYKILVGNQSVQNRSGMMDFFNFSDGNGFSFGFGDSNDSTMAFFHQQMNESMKRLEEQMEQMMRGFSDTSMSRSFQFDGFGDFDKMFDSFGDSSGTWSFHFDTVIGELPNRSNPYFGSNTHDLVDFPDKEPQYVGGVDAMNAFVASELKSAEAQILSTGTVFIEAIIEKDGSISRPTVALGVEPEMDKEALRIVQQMPLWNPAMMENEAVRSRTIIPIQFGK